MTQLTRRQMIGIGLIAGISAGSTSKAVVQDLARQGQIPKYTR